MEKYIKKIDNLLDKINNSEVEEMLKQLRNDIIFDMALKRCNSNNKKEQLRYAKQLLADAKKDKARPLIHKMYQIDDTYQLTDGYIGVVLKEPITGLELNTNEGQYFDCRTVINRTGKNYYDYDYNYKEVDIDLLELEQLVLKIKKYKEPPYPTEFLGNKYNTYYSPLRLLTAIKILGTENVKVYFHTSSEKSPIYLKSDLGEGLVLPITVPKQEK